MNIPTPPKAPIAPLPTNPMAMLVFGSVFGFILSRVGAGSYDAISQMFRLTDLHLAGVIVMAIVVAGIGFSALRWRGIAGPADCAVVLKPKPRKSGNVVGSILFGAGWAITGACPGTTLVMLGEGQLLAAFTIAGILVGVALHRRYGARVEAGLAALTTPNQTSTRSAAQGSEAP